MGESSFDVRDETSLNPKHWSAPEVFGSRAKFNIDSMPASLVIKVSSYMIIIICTSLDYGHMSSKCGCKWK